MQLAPVSVLGRVDAGVAKSPQQNTRAEPCGLVCGMKRSEIEALTEDIGVHSYGEGGGELA